MSFQMNINFQADFKVAVKFQILVINSKIGNELIQLIQINLFFCSAEQNFTIVIQSTSPHLNLKGHLFDLLRRLENVPKEPLKFITVLQFVLILQFVL